MKTLFISQPFGQGDHIFCVELARQLKEATCSDRILWGSVPQFVDGNKRAYSDIEWINNWDVPQEWYRVKQRSIDGNTVIEPVRWADEIQKVPYTQCMRAKYDMYGLDFNIWRNAIYQRDPQREKRLAEIVGAMGEYTLVNRFYGSENQFTASIRPPSGRVVEMRAITGYSLFDWSSIMENAQEVHAVSSSILYLLELLDLKQPLHLYPRNGDPKYKQVYYLFTKEYKLH